MLLCNLYWKKLVNIMTDDIKLSEIPKGRARTLAIIRKIYKEKGVVYGVWVHEEYLKLYPDDPDRSPNVTYVHAFRLMKDGYITSGRKESYIPTDKEFNFKKRGRKSGCGSPDGKNKYFRCYYSK